MNGEERKMVCTLVEQFLPDKYSNTDNPTDFDEDYGSNEESTLVWDLEKHDWRAFKYDSITEISIKSGKLNITVFPEDDDGN